MLINYMEKLVNKVVNCQMIFHCRNWREFSMSAVCVYAMEDIEELFDSGRFLSERTLHIEPSAA